MDSTSLIPRLYCLNEIKPGNEANIVPGNIHKVPWYLLALSLGFPAFWGLRAEKAGKPGDEARYLLLMPPSPKLEVTTIVRIMTHKIPIQSTCNYVDGAKKQNHVHVLMYNA